MDLVLITAMDKLGGIGKDNKLPWNIPADLKHFANLTKGYPVIVGRKTHESMPDLPGRDVIVITSHNYNKPDRQPYHTALSIQEAIGTAYTMNKKMAFVIGGKQIYDLALPHCTHMVVTHVNDTYTCDTYFPAYHRPDWKEFIREALGEHDVVTYHRVKASKI